MTMLDPAERSARGREWQEKILAAPAPEPTSLYEASWRDYVFAEVWSRPGLDLRARYLISLAGTACNNDAVAVQGFARGALKNGELTLAELREAALQVATYNGWSTGGVFDAGVSAAAAELGLAELDVEPMRAAPWDPAQRTADGAARFIEVTGFGGPPPVLPFFSAGVLDYVFAELWTRPGLDQRSRRWLTLMSVGMSSAQVPVNTHVWSAMHTGDTTKAEMLEFALPFAIHAGWPRASIMHGAILEQAKRIEQGLPFEP